MVPVMPPTAPVEDFLIPTTPESPSYWNQFEENQRLFGTTSTYDPSMSAYTTPLVIDSLTPEQIAKADELAKISLPSQALALSACPYCDTGFDSAKAVVDHYISVLVGDNTSCGCSDEGRKALKALVRRKSWIVVQETLPTGLVSQVEGLYKRQITSSTNIQMIIDAVTASSTEFKEYLMSELVSLVVSLASQQTPSDRKPTEAPDGKVSSRRSAPAR